MIARRQAAAADGRGAAPPAALAVVLQDARVNLDDCPAARRRWLVLPVEGGRRVDGECAGVPLRLRQLAPLGQALLQEAPHGVRLENTVAIGQEFPVRRQAVES